MHLKNTQGQVVKPKLTALNQYADYFYIDGRVTLPLMRGQYEFELEAGPEYRTQKGHFEIDRHADDTKTIEMHRFADLAKEGWWSPLPRPRPNGWRKSGAGRCFISASRLSARLVTTTMKAIRRPAQVSRASNTPRFRKSTSL